MIMHVFVNISHSKIILLNLPLIIIKADTHSFNPLGLLDTVDVIN